MSTTYTYPKEIMKREEISYLKIFFYNGDYILIPEGEIVDFSAKLCDKLRCWKDGAAFMVAQGHVKLRLGQKTKAHKWGAYVHDAEEYRTDRKRYIENRCTKSGEISHICIYDELNWSFPLFGEVTATLEGDDLILQMAHGGACEEKNSSIQLGNITKSNIRKLCLDFENCETIDVYGSEIIDCNLNFEEELIWCSELFRQIKSGYIVLRLNSENESRGHTLHFMPARLSRLGKTRYFEDRIAPTEGAETHDICNLYITDGRCMGNMLRQEECLVLRNLCEREMSDEEEDSDDERIFVGGFSTRLANGDLFVAFGKHAERLAAQKCGK